MKKFFWPLVLLASILVGWNLEAIAGFGPAQGASGGGGGGGTTYAVSPSGGTATSTGVGSFVVGTGSSDGGFAGTTVLGPGLTGFAAAQTLVGATVTWPSGLGNVVHVEGPRDNFLQMCGRGGAADGVLIFGELVGGLAKGAVVEVDCISDGSQLNLRSGNASDGTGATIYMQSAVGTNGKPDGYVDTDHSILSHLDGVASLGSNGAGRFAGLHLTSTAVASWNDDTGISRSGAASIAFGTAAQGNATAQLLARAISLNTGASGVDLGFSVAGTTQLASAGVYAFTNGNSNGTADTGLSRIAAAVTGFGNGSAGDFSGRVQSGFAAIGSRTVTALNPVLALDQTWNNAGVSTFTGILERVSVTAGSGKLLDFYAGASGTTAEFSVTSAGRAQATSHYAGTTGTVFGFANSASDASAALAGGVSWVSTSTLAVGNGTAADASLALALAGNSYTITASTGTPVELNAPSVHSNAGSSVDITFKLAPTPTTGQVQVLVVTAAHYVKAAASTGTKIYLGATASATAGFVRSNVIGSTVTLVYDGTEWVALSVTGTWTVDS